MSDSLTVLKAFCGILQSELQLDDGQVYVWDQKINIPTDDKLYIAVGVESVTPFGSKTQFIDGDEYQSANFKATLSIDILSRGSDARDRKEEVILALKSTYAQQVQEKYGFYIATLTSGFTNLSEIEGAAIPYRFNLALNLQYAVSKSKAVDYYDTFTKEIRTEA